MTDEAEVQEEVEGLDIFRPNRTKQELKQIAMDLLDDKIFSDRHLREGEAPTMMQMIFMPLVFMDEQQMPLFLAQRPNFIFEYTDKAGPRSVNGYPIFFSMQYLNEEESKIMFDYYDKFVETKKKLMEDD